MNCVEMQVQPSVMKAITLNEDMCSNPGFTSNFLCGLNESLPFSGLAVIHLYNKESGLVTL